MEVIRTREELRGHADDARREVGSVGFVPTMGAFHEGHLSLIRRARAADDLVAVSIFVNPLQFGPNEDLARYPRGLDRDLELARGEGVDVVFAPDLEEMYPGGAPAVTIGPGRLGDRLEGAFRPGHFRGVCTVVAKLFNAVGACTAYFGEKDAQQLHLVRSMVRDLGFPVNVAGCPTVREPDGLAMSSRNAFLSPEDRERAACLSRALREAERMVTAGERSVSEIAGAMSRLLEDAGGIDVDYVAIVDEESFDDIEHVGRPARALVAARIGAVRLIDNMPLRPVVGDNASEMTGNGTP
jgi:pantoate--beta-alanine ligase